MATRQFSRRSGADTMKVFFLSCASLLLLSNVGLAQGTATLEKPAEQQESVNPGINDTFLDPELDVEQFVERFEAESREIFRARQEIVDHLQLKPGDRIADIGAGTGLFLEPFAKAVGPTGHVYPLDIAPAFVERSGKLAEELGLANVTPVLAGQDNIRLPPASIDAAFICDTYHHFEFPQTSLASIYRAIKPGGQLVVIDFERIPGKSRDWTLGHVRAGKEVFRSEIEEAGFKFVEEVTIDAFEENYFLRFRRE